MRISDWSSDVCSSDLIARRQRPVGGIATASPSIGNLRHPHWFRLWNIITAPAAQPGGCLSIARYSLPLLLLAGASKAPPVDRLHLQEASAERGHLALQRVLCCICQTIPRSGGPQCALVPALPQFINTD